MIKSLRKNRDLCTLNDNSTLQLMFILHVMLILIRFVAIIRSATKSHIKQKKEFQLAEIKAKKSDECYKYNQVFNC